MFCKLAESGNVFLLLWNSTGDLNTPTLMLDISFHITPATWTRIRHFPCFTCTRQPDRNHVQPESQALLLCRWMHGYSCFPTSPPYQRGYQSEVAKFYFSGKHPSFSEQKRCLCQSLHTRLFQQPGSISGWTGNEIVPKRWINTHCPWLWWKHPLSARRGGGGRHIMPVAVMEAIAVSAMERAGDWHIMPVAVMEAPTVCGTGGCKTGTERVGSAPLTSINGLFRNPDITLW